MSAIKYRTFDSQDEEKELETVQTLVSNDLSEPYSVYVFRYFIYEWPELCFLVSSESKQATDGVL